MVFRKNILQLFFVLMVVFILLGTGSAQNNKVEIFSWWTGGGEEESLQALLKIFQQKYPQIEVINATVEGGAGINAKATLRTRMVGGNPPDSFQVHGGAELIDSYVKTGMMEPITKYLDAWGVRGQFNKQVIDMCSYKGEIYSIPLDVQRGNMLWYNKNILRKYNITPPKTIPELTSACRKLSRYGIIPLSLGDKNKWEATHLFETILVARMGPLKYNGLWKNQTSFNDPNINGAFMDLKQLIQFVNKDHATLTWQDATKMVASGKAAFNIMGDWAEGYFKTLGGMPGKSFGWVPLGNNFMVITDSFGLPKGTPHRRGALAWLATISSVEGQDTFNLVKGSIPARIDVNRQLFDPYQQQSMDDFVKLTLTPSIVHGSAAPQGFSDAMDDLVNTFIYDGNLKKANQSLHQIVSDYLE